MEPIAALTQAFDEMERVVGGVRSDQLTNATPCREWDARALLNHAFTVVAGIGGAAGGKAPGGGALTLDEGDLKGQFRSLADDALAGWRSPGTLERTFDAGAGPRLGAEYAAINLLDTLVHAWDVAKATDQPTELPRELVEHTLGLCHGFITPEIRAFAGFDPAVEVGADASPTAQLAAFLGRQP